MSLTEDHLLKHEQNQQISLMAEWDEEQTRHFVLGLGKGKVWTDIADILFENGIDGSILEEMHADDLEELMPDIKRVVRNILLKKVRKYNNPITKFLPTGSVSTSVQTGRSCTFDELRRCRKVAEIWVEMYNIGVHRDDLATRIDSIRRKKCPRLQMDGCTIPHNVIKHCLHVLRRAGNIAAHIRGQQDYTGGITEPQFMQIIKSLKVLQIPFHHVFKQGNIDERVARRI